jgi:ribonuclease E
MNKLLILGLILIVAGLVAVPAFAQVLPQGETGVTDPAGGGGSVPQDVTSTEPSSTEDVGLPTDGATNPAAPAEGSAADVIPVELSSELCADVTDPLVVGTFEQVLPEVVQGCLERASIPAGNTAPVNPAPAETAPVDTVPVEPAPIDTNPPNQATSVYP